MSTSLQITTSDRLQLAGFDRYMSVSLNLLSLFNVNMIRLRIFKQNLYLKSVTAVTTLIQEHATGPGTII